MPNRLADETSPYLLQHAGNPVDWHPWGDEAFALARRLDKPVLLSIGYAACHWCHVMAHESFEDEAIAELMNRNFVNIKVDREERPDVDSIYMSAVQALTNQGGWPMTVFLTPEGKPFYGGTYFPPQPRYGMPSFPQLLHSITDAWQTKRSEIENSADGIAKHLQESTALSIQRVALSPDLLDQALNGIIRKFDAEQGGFSAAPKFPPSMTLEFLLRLAAANDAPVALQMAEFTLTRMANSGLYDQIGGGFARYATDNDWLVPHFEKMLYDNALLARVYLHAYQLTGEPLYRRVATETLDFVARELREEQGGFFSSYDADSEGQEGKFYVWQLPEIAALLGKDAALFSRYYGVSAAGNWEQQNILHVTADLDTVAIEFGLTTAQARQRLSRAREILYEARSQRIWPGLDDKVLTSWNGLMLAAFAEAGRVLNHEPYTRIARANARFLFDTLRREDGRLMRTWKVGALARYDGYLEDYAYLADGLLALYQTTFETQWFSWAVELVELMLAHFYDEEQGGFYNTADDHESLLYRPKDLQDNATPSANAMAARVLLLLNLYTGDSRYWDIAEWAISGLYEFLARYPTGFAHWLGAATIILGDPLEVAIIGPLEDSATRALLDVTNTEFRPTTVVAAGQSTPIIPLLANRVQIDGRPTAYVCRRFVCNTPVTDPQALSEQLT